MISLSKGLDAREVAVVCICGDRASLEDSAGVISRKLPRLHDNRVALAIMFQRDRHPVRILFGPISPAF